jgi:hypothetical protein
MEESTSKGRAFVRLSLARFGLDWGGRAFARAYRSVSHDGYLAARNTESSAVLEGTGVSRFQRGAPQSACGEEDGDLARSSTRPVMVHSCRQLRPALTLHTRDDQ